MVLLEKLWDDIVDRYETNRRLAGLRKISTPPLIITADHVGGCKYKRTKSVPAGWSASVVTPIPPVCKDSVWGSVFYQGMDKEISQAAVTSASLQIQPGHFFNKTQPYTYTGLYCEEAKGKQPLVT